MFIIFVTVEKIKKLKQIFHRFCTPKNILLSPTVYPVHTAENN